MCSRALEINFCALHNCLRVMLIIILSSFNGQYIQLKYHQKIFREKLNMFLEFFPKRTAIRHIVMPVCGVVKRVRSRTISLLF